MGDNYLDFTHSLYRLVLRQPGYQFSLSPRPSFPLISHSCPIDPHFNSIHRHQIKDRLLFPVSVCGDHKSYKYALAYVDRALMSNSAKWI